jgi:threonine aldolase
VRTIDLRRDTITLPSAEMRDRAFRAELGDSVYGEDPSQEELEKLAARLLGTEEALFVPSGTMGNLVALLSWTSRGDEVILEENAHIRSSETGGAACVGGLLLRGVPGPGGVPDPRDIEAAVRADDIHYPRTSLICLENTHYRYGGIAAAPGAFAAVKQAAGRLGLPVHLDGARIFNAAVAFGVDVREYTRHVDSVMVSLSKGLGAPVGSVLAGSAGFAKKARRWRKMLGGGMRQTGWLAACGIVALSGAGIARLADDHANARLLAEGLARLAGFSVDTGGTRTNFVVARFRHHSMDATALAAAMKARGVLVHPADAGTLRFVTSSRVTADDVREALRVLGELVGAG